MTTQSFIISILGYVFGAGGLLAFFIQLRNAKHVEHKDAVEDWHQLYTATLENVTRVETENRELRGQITDMQNKILQLTIELEGYKRFERYVTEQEVYINNLLHVVEPLVSDDAYKRLEATRPVRIKIDTDDIVDLSSDQKEE